MYETIKQIELLVDTCNSNKNGLLKNNNYSWINDVRHPHSIAINSIYVKRTECCITESLFEVSACHMFGSKPFSGPMLTYCHWPKAGLVPGAQ